MDQWSGVKQDEVTAGIGCQSVTGPSKTGLSGGCHIIFIIKTSSCLLLRDRNIQPWIGLEWRVKVGLLIS